MTRRALTMSRTDLDRRIAEERMHELQPHGQPPEWLWHLGTEQPRVWTMHLDGTLSASWQWLDTLDWRDVAAIRMEYAHGQVIDPAALESADDLW